MFRGLLFEAEADAFQKAGIEIGAKAAASEEALLQEALSPFSVQRRSDALQMARLYALLYCFENELRDFIRQTLFEKDGPNWEDALPPNMLAAANQRKTTALADTWLEGEKSDILGFFDFGHLARLIIEKWDHFKDLLPSQHWIKQRMDEIEKSRNFIAHNRKLLPSEFQRLYMYVADWNRVIGL